MIVSMHREQFFYPKEIVDDYGDLIYQVSTEYRDLWVIFGPNGVLSKHDCPKQAEKAYQQWEDFFKSRPNRKNNK